VSADVVFLYDQILESFSRLRCLDVEREDEIDNDIGSDVEHITTLLSRRDLLIFASTTRNFAEATASIDEMKKHPIRLSEIYLSSGPPFFRNKKQSINLHQALSRILHAHDTSVLRTPGAFIAETSASSDEFIRRLLKEKDEFPDNFETFIRISTKKEGSSFFPLARLLKAASTYLQVIVDKLAEKGTFLERNLRDV
jgi:hypothetical protein